MIIEITKLTNINLLRKCAGYTTGKDCKMSLVAAYRHHHSLIRSQIFFIELRNIPLFVASQFVRSHVGVQFFQRSKRTDRGGADFKSACDSLSERVSRLPSTPSEFALNIISEISEDIKDLPENYDRYAPTDLAFIINAEAILNMAHKRLCTKASKETREIWQAVCGALKDVDPDLHKHLVPMCVFRGGICGEPKCCGFNKTETFKRQLEDYKSLFE